MMVRPEFAFEFATAQRIIFGPEKAQRLPELVAGYGRQVLAVTGADPARQARVLASIEERARRFDVFPVGGEPTVSLVVEGAQRARASGIEVVVAIGGGSAIDAAKAIAALAANPGDPFDYLEVVGRAQPLVHDPLPVLAVPTTAGTGAEVTRNAVLSVPEEAVKVSLRSPRMLPVVALVDPTLACGLPAGPTAATGMDALTQLIEPFLSRRANPMTDALCREGLAGVARSLRTAVREPEDLAARTDMALAALFGGLALANAGLGAVHGFAGPLGGMLGAPHGALCAVLLPPVLRANLAALRARAPGHRRLERFDELARILTGRPAAVAEEAIEWCVALVRDLAIPPLSAWGLRPEAIEAAVDKAERASSMKANPIDLNRAELAGILSAAG